MQRGAGIVMQRGSRDSNAGGAGIVMQRGEGILDSNAEGDKGLEERKLGWELGTEGGRAAGTWEGERGSRVSGCNTVASR